MHKGIVSIAHICTHQNYKLQISFNDACASVLNEYMRVFFLFFQLFTCIKLCPLVNGVLKILELLFRYLKGMSLNEILYIDYCKLVSFFLNTISIAILH